MTRTRINTPWVVFCVVILGLAGCASPKFPTEDHRVVAQGVAERGGDVALSMKQVDSELQFQEKKFDEAFESARKALQSSDEKVRDGIYKLGNYCVTPDSKSDWLILLEKSKSDQSSYIRSRYVYYLMLVPGSQWRPMAESQKSSNDPLLREAAEAALRVGALREQNSKVNPLR